MAQPQSHFRRAVLGLQSHPSKLGMLIGVDVARLLDLELFGLFVEEESLLHLAGLPFAREFNPLGGGWRSIDGDRLSRDLQAAAHNAQRLFAAAVKGMPRSCGFGVVRGSMTEAISAHTRAGDIVIFPASADLADYPSDQVPALVETALRTAEGVLLVPRQLARQAGDIVAIATRTDDPSVSLAAAIARAAREELVIVELFSADDRTAGGIAEGGLAEHRTAGRVVVSDPALLITALRGERERLVVITHGGADPALPSMLASWRRVPVLVIASDRRGEEPELGPP